MPIIEDRELGKITIRRSAKASNIRMRVAPDGTLRVSAPHRMPMFMIKRAIAGSRHELQTMIDAQRPVLAYQDGDTIGKSHSLAVRRGASLGVKREGLRIIVTLPGEMGLTDADAQELLRGAVIAALRREAKGYLPKRLDYLAQKHGFFYRQIRFSHASSRWGSCSSEGTISLNIALMKLPFELIDYVIIHELAHTREMNHSKAFWDIVEMYDPSYLTHRAKIKHENPTI